MDERVDRDLDALHGGGVGGDAQLTGRRGDLPSQLEVALAQPEEVVVRGRGQPHRLGSQVDVEVMVRAIGEPADGVHQCNACRERLGAKVRVRDVRQHPPVLDAVGVVELLGRDRLGHVFSVTLGIRQILSEARDRTSIWGSRREPG